VFKIAVDDAQHLGGPIQDPQHMVTEEVDSARRAYITAAVRVRLHQRAFRERVLAAYQVQCAFCRLRHEELLDAAHIIPDVEPAGEPLIRNGLSLCTLHHAAFDRYFIGIRPDFTLEVREDLRHEKDGPTLVHAIQGLHDSRIVLPRRVDYRPGVELLQQRYERFLQAQSGMD
jgi:putative restriction endonuclease